jgi:hypothetical protein
MCALFTLNAEEDKAKKQSLDEQQKQKGQQQKKPLIQELN